MSIAAYYSKNSWHPSNNSDPVFDEYFENARAAITIEEQKEWLRKADLRVAEQLWTIRGPITPLFGVTQPWIKGYNSEEELGPMNRSDIFAYLRVDKE